MLEPKVASPASSELTGYANANKAATALNAQGHHGQSADLSAARRTRPLLYNHHTAGNAEQVRERTRLWTTSRRAVDVSGTRDRPHRRRHQALSARSRPSTASISPSNAASCLPCWAARAAARPRCCACWPASRRPDAGRLVTRWPGHDRRAAASPADQHDVPGPTPPFPRT